MQVFESNSLQVIGEYKRFLRLSITENIALTPSTLVDELWHQHILNSTEYFQFCMRAAGRYIHHAPHYEKSHSFHRDSFNLTHKLYKKHFGRDAPQTIWSHMGDSCSPDPLYFRDSPTSVVVKLSPRNVNKDHYTQIHPVFRCKGMSINLWRDFLRDFLRDIDNVPLMSWKEYMKLDKNSYFHLLERAFFHVSYFAWVVVPFALGYTNNCSNETCIDELLSYFGSLSLLQRGWYVWSGVSFCFPGFLPNKFLHFFKLSRIACCIGSLCIFMKQTILLNLLIGLLLSFSTDFCVNRYILRSFNPKNLQKIISRYADLFSEMGVIVALSDDMTITIEAHL